MHINISPSAPIDATYITQTANGTLTAEQNLAALATGLLKNTTSTGVLSIASSPTDFLADAPSDGSFYGRQNAAWVAANTLPVVDETPVVYKTSFPLITQTHDVNAYTVARIVTWPDAAMTVAGLQVSNLFTVRQDIRASGSGVAAGLHVPWITGDTVAAVVAGSANASNNRTGVYGISSTSFGVRGDSTSSAGVTGTSSSGAGVSSTSISGNGGQFTSTSGRGVSCQSNTGEPMDAIQVTGTDNAVSDLFVIRKRPLATAAIGFGSALRFKLSSDTNADQQAGRLSWEWATATHASRASRGKLTAYSVASEIECIQWDATGLVTMPMVRLTSTTEASLSSTLHAFQIGADASTNIVIDQDEIQARSNGATASLNLNPAGGSVVAGGQVSAVSLRATLVTATTLAGSPQAFQTGGNSVANIAIDTASVQARNNGAASALTLNPLGGNILIGIVTASLGFYGSAAVAQQTVTGSRGANAALASLLTALATLGLIVDSSS